MPTSPLQRRLATAFILLRLPVAVATVVLTPGMFDRVAPVIFPKGFYGHGAAKALLAPLVTMVFRQEYLPLALGFTAVAAVVLARLRGRAWAIAAAVLAGVAVLAPIEAWKPGIGLFTGLLLLNLWPSDGDRWRRAALVPGTELLFPVHVARAVGVPARLAMVAALLFPFAWFVVDASAMADRVSDRVWDWPESKLDPRIRVVARAAAGVHSEFQDIDAVGDRINVIAESSLRLLSFPRTLDAPPRVSPLQPWWGPHKGLTLDSETDPASGVTWHLDGPWTVKAIRWNGDVPEVVGVSERLPRPLEHAYTRYIPERNKLVLTTINVVEEPNPPSVTVLDTPDLTHPVLHELRTADNHRLPHIRDVEWIPTLGKLVLAPDFGSRLYLADIDTGLAEPWLEVPTLNGRMHWCDELGRLFLAMPDRFEVLVVDPVAGKVERSIPTQPGVRPLAVDAKRGLLVTASIATGAVWVQRVDDGSLVDSFRTILPMVREMALLKDEGIAVITTWSQVYAVPYGANADK